MTKPAAKKTAPLFTDLDNALDVLDGAGIGDIIEEATDALDTATSVEGFADYKANLEDAAVALRRALACIERLAARVPA